MFAVKLRGQITNNKRLIVELPIGIAPGAVEVIILHGEPPKARKKRRRKSAHPAFGIWANRVEITNSASHAAELRRKIESREDGRR